MNEHRETMNEVSTTSSAIVGYRGEAQKRPYAPPRVEQLIGTNRDTAGGGKNVSVGESGVGDTACGS
jgi:hypothetical protein